MVDLPLFNSFAILALLLNPSHKSQTEETNSLLETKDEIIIEN